MSLLALALSACVPAQTPPLLSATPGEAVVVTGNQYANDLFSLTYPTGWRVITSPAGAPPSVTLVAPGDCALIVVATTPVEAPSVSGDCAQEDILSQTRDIRLNNTSISLAGSAPLSQWDDFLIAFENIAGSLEARS